MGRSLSPALRMELENLDKDADSRKAAMKALKLYVKDLDSKAIPMFLAQVSETKQTGITYGEHTISLYEVLARVHGPKIVPQIDNIMTSIVKTLSSSAGAFALHQACSKVVPAIARYAMDPTTAKDEKRHAIHSICKPLSDCLLGSTENLSSGAAMCLQALVECDNWRFASNEMVNEVCQKVSGALEKYSQTNSHMALVTALAKHNSLMVEAYARLLIQSGLRILDDGFVEANSQKQLSAVHMVSSLMRCLDPKSIISELELVIKEMEKCQFERMPFVTGAAFEALQIAKKIYSEKGEKGSGSGTRRRSACSSGELSPLNTSPESHTADSFIGYDYFIESPVSMNQMCRDMDYECRSVNRKLWERSENGGVNISLKDGIFSEITRGSDVMGSEYGEFSDNHGDCIENFAGFIHESATNGYSRSNTPNGRAMNGFVRSNTPNGSASGFLRSDTPNGSASNGFLRSNTPSPSRSNSHINVDDVRIFTTPRKLIRSLQDQEDINSRSSVRQTRRFRSLMPMSTPTSKHEQNGLCQDTNLSSGIEQFHCSSESVSSTEDVLFTDEGLPVSVEIPANNSRRKSFKSAHVIVCGLFVVLFAVMLCLVEIGDQGDHHILVPT